MKILKLLPGLALSLLFLQANAQEAPKGFGKGKVTLADNTVVTGFIKDNIRKDASVTLLVNGQEKKTPWLGCCFSKTQCHSLPLP
ncbi:MAG: hypothetical protein ACKOU7_07780, partial [Ferruginibacter sp.]